MFDIGGLELLLITVVALLVIGPERLPETLRTLGLWLGRLRRSFTSVKAEIEKEIGMDEVKRQLHNEAVMEEMKRIEREVKHSVDGSQLPPESPSQVDAEADANSIDPKQTEQAPDTPIPTNDIDPAVEPPPETPKPRSEAELEAAHARRQRASGDNAAAEEN